MKNFSVVFILLLCSCLPSGNDKIYGYIEGENIYISPIVSGVLEEIYVKKGDFVNQGDKLFSVDFSSLTSNIDIAKLSVDRAYSNYANLEKGKRKEEVLVLIEQKNQAEAFFENAKTEYERSKTLLPSKIISQAVFDLKRADYLNKQAKLKEILADLEVATLGARVDEVLMAKNEIDIAKENLKKAEKIFRDSNPLSMVYGTVIDVYYRKSETASAGIPVLAILPNENLRAYFYVSQKLLPNIKLGQNIFIDCDGCKQKTPAKISFISPRAQYTPPVIYSIETREKLLFRVEAIPNGNYDSLHIGLPIDIYLEEK